MKRFLILPALVSFVTSTFAIAAAPATEADFALGSTPAYLSLEEGQTGQLRIWAVDNKGGHDFFVEIESFSDVLSGYHYDQSTGVLTYTPRLLPGRNPVEIHSLRIALHIRAKKPGAYIYSRTKDIPIYVSRKNPAN